MRHSDTRLYNTIPTQVTRRPRINNEVDFYLHECKELFKKLEKSSEQNKKLSEVNCDLVSDIKKLSKVNSNLASENNKLN